MEQRIRALYGNDQYLHSVFQKFSRLNTEKFTAGILYRIQTRRLLKISTNFEAAINEVKQLACKSFQAVPQTFLEIDNAENYEKLVDEMIDRFETLGCNISTKVHYTHNHNSHFQHDLCEK